MDTDPTLPLSSDFIKHNILVYLNLDELFKFSQAGKELRELARDVLNEQQRPNSLISNKKHFIISIGSLLNEFSATFNGKRIPKFPTDSHPGYLKEAWRLYSRVKKERSNCLKRTRELRLNYRDYNTAFLEIYTEKYAIWFNTPRSSSECNRSYAEKQVQIITPASQLWCVDLNAIWMFGHIQAGSAVKVLAKFDQMDNFWNKEENRPTVLGTELLQLYAAGYEPKPIEERTDRVRRAFLKPEYPPQTGNETTRQLMANIMSDSMSMSSYKDHNDYRNFYSSYGVLLQPGATARQKKPCVTDFQGSRNAAPPEELKRRILAFIEAIKNIYPGPISLPPNALGYRAPCNHCGSIITTYTRGDKYTLYARCENKNCPNHNPQSHVGNIKAHPYIKGPSSTLTEVGPVRQSVPSQDNSIHPYLPKLS